MDFRKPGREAREYFAGPTPSGDMYMFFLEVAFGDAAPVLHQGGGDVRLFVIARRPRDPRSGWRFFFRV